MSDDARRFLQQEEAALRERWAKWQELVQQYPEIPSLMLHDEILLPDTERGREIATAIQQQWTEVPKEDIPLSASPKCSGRTGRGNR